MDIIVYDNLVILIFQDLLLEILYKISNRTYSVPIKELISGINNIN